MRKDSLARRVPLQGPARLALCLSLALLAGCGAQDRVPGRWYSMAQVEQGRALFQTHCAQCHGARAEGLGDWQRRGPDGLYPAPPLNGSAHAWHHPLPMLQQQILQGGIPLGGSMPGFTGILEEAEVLASIAYFQSFWSEDIYAQWKIIDARVR